MPRPSPMLDPWSKMLRKVVRPGRSLPPDTCWLWMGWRDAWYGEPGKGYGRTCVRGKRVSTHRAAWELNFGPIPEGLCVLHRCDVPNCVRPDHLFLGTRAENIADMDAKGRRVTMRGEASGSPLTEDDVRSIRWGVRLGQTHRAMSARYGVSQPAVTNIVHGKTWGHVALDAEPSDAGKVRAMAPVELPPLPDRSDYFRARRLAKLGRLPDNSVPPPLPSPSHVVS